LEHLEREAEPGVFRHVQDQFKRRGCCRKKKDLYLGDASSPMSLAGGRGIRRERGGQSLEREDGFGGK